MPAKKDNFISPPPKASCLKTINPNILKEYANKKADVPPTIIFNIHDGPSKIYLIIIIKIAEAINGSSSII